jgi:uncharacterized small protein (DUF1192 family)
MSNKELASFRTLYNYSAVRNDILEKEINRLRSQIRKFDDEISKINLLQEEISKLRCQLSKFDSSIILNDADVDYGIRFLTRDISEYKELCKVVFSVNDDNVFAQGCCEGKDSIAVKFSIRPEVRKEGLDRIVKHILDHFNFLCKKKWG